VTFLLCDNFVVLYDFAVCQTCTTLKRNDNDVHAASGDDETARPIVSDR